MPPVRARTTARKSRTNRKPRRTVTKPKPRAVSSRKHPGHNRHHAFEAHHADVTRVANVPYSTIPRRVVTVHGTANAQSISIPAGNRLAIFPLIGGSNAFGYFHVPRGNATWSNTDLLSVGSTDASMFRFSNVFTATGNTAFGTGTAFASESARDARIVPYHGTNPVTVVTGAHPVGALADNEAMPGRYSMQSGKFEIDIRTANIMETAQAWVFTTDSHNKETQLINVGDNGARDNHTDLRVRKGPGVPTNQTIETIMAAGNPKYTKAGVMHIAGQWRPYHPSWFYSHQLFASGATTATQAGEIAAGMCPENNPFLSFLAHGTMIIIEANSGAVNVTIHMSNIVAVERIKAVGVSDADSMIRMNLLKDHEHCTTNSESVLAQYQAPVGQPGFGYSPQEAREDVSSNVEQASGVSSIFGAITQMVMPTALAPSKDVNNTVSALPSTVDDQTDTAKTIEEVAAHAPEIAAGVVAGAGTLISGVAGGVSSLWAKFRDRNKSAGKDAAPKKKTKKKSG